MKIIVETIYVIDYRFSNSEEDFFIQGLNLGLNSKGIKFTLSNFIRFNYGSDYPFKLEDLHKN